MAGTEGMLDGARPLYMWAPDAAHAPREDGLLLAGGPPETKGDRAGQLDRARWRSMEIGELGKHVIVHWV